MSDTESGEDWAPPPMNVARDAVATIVVLAVLAGGVWLYLADDPRETIIWALSWFVALATLALGLSLTHRILAGWIGGVPRPAAQSSQATAAAEPDTLSAMKPSDIFGLWANSSLMLEQNAVVLGNEAYQHYSRACAVNGVQPMSSNQFGTLLTRRAEASGGLIIKTKSNGKMAYRGWALSDGEAPAKPVALASAA